MNRTSCGNATSVPPHESEDREHEKKASPNRRASDAYVTDGTRTGWILDNLADNTRIPSAYLVSFEERYTLSEKEMKDCLGFIQVLRTDFWFAHWIRKLIRGFTNQGMRYTPAEILCEAAEAAQEFAVDLQEARRLMAIYPELVDPSAYHTAEAEEGEN